MNLGITGNVEIRRYSNLGVLRGIDNISNTITYVLAQGLVEKIIYSTSLADITPRYILRANTKGNYEVTNKADYKDMIQCSESNDAGEVYDNDDHEIGRSASFKFMIPSQSWLGDDIVSMAIASSSGDILAIINFDNPINKSSDNYFDIRWNFNVIKGGE